jgi:MoaA/NifB/PqqE/SkfB family radical SAM enzyme
MSLNLRVVENLLTDRLGTLPLAIIYITDRCNSKCVTCDYWRYGQTNMTLPVAQRLADELPALGTKMVLISGGEPLLHPRWHELVSLFQARGMEIALLTSGILLPKNLDRVPQLCAHTIVSLDGATPETYEAIRGVNGFALVEKGVRGLVERGAAVSLRCTVQRANYRELPAIIRIAKAWGVQSVSFLAVDVSTHQAFARAENFAQTMALTHDDLLAFDAVLDDVEKEFVAEFISGLIEESPAKLRRLRQYFAALLGEDKFPFVRCNAPRWSTVIETDGSLKPCYFLPAWGRMDGRSLREAINTPEAQAIRRAQRNGEREECQRCVCYAYRGKRELLQGELIR